MHPWCRCYATPILPNENAFFKGLTADLKGGANPYGTPVTTMPSRFTKWIADNTERVKNGSTVPYWIKDNFKNGNIEEGLKFGAISANTNTSISDIEKLAKAVGVNIEKPMEHEQANTNRPNPHYAEDEQYRINCQSAVVTYELRRRGMPVEAFGNTAKNDTVGICMGEVLATNTRAAWVTEEGKMPEYIISKKQITGRSVDKRGYVRHTYSTNQEIMQDFYNKTSEAGRYHVSWNWDKSKKGHIITMEVLKDGTRRFYDPQTGINSKNIIPWAWRKGKIAMDLNRGLYAYRVDNLQPNPIVCRGVVKKAGSNLQTPVVDKEQREWWKKNVLQKEGKTTRVFSAIQLTPEEKARRKEIKETASVNFKDLKMYNASYDKPITISNTKIKEWLNQPFNEYLEKNEALLNLPAILEKSKYLGWGKDKRYDYLQMHLFETKIKNTPAWIIVQRDENGISTIHSITDRDTIKEFLTHKK